MEPDKTDNGTLHFYVGTYARADAPGIYLCRLDLSTGETSLAGQWPAGPNPSFVAIHPTRRWLYAVNELQSFQGQPDGGVSAFAINPADGSLTLLNQQPSHGADPCHVTVDRSGRCVIVSNYSSGTVAVYPVENDGRLGSATQVIRQEAPDPADGKPRRSHAHAVNMDLGNRFALCCNLGLDKVLVYRLDPDRARLEPHGETLSRPGAGPRHVDFHPTGRYVYVINELDATMTAHAYDADGGRLSELQTVSTVPGDYSGQRSGAEVAVHPSGRFLYASNRGHNSIAIYSIDESTGRLTLGGHESTQGRAPRCFAIDPTGNYLLAANQDSSTIVTFRIDLKTGALAQCHRIEIPRPVCVVF